MKKFYSFALALTVIACGSKASTSNGSDSSAGGDSRDTGIVVDTNSVNDSPETGIVIDIGGDLGLSDIGANDSGVPTSVFDGIVSEATACTGANFTSTAKPPIIAFMLDRSGSMSNYPSDPQGNGASYYPTTYTAPAGCPNLCNGITQNDADFAVTKFGYLRSAIDQLTDGTNLPADWQVSFAFFAPPGITDTTSAPYCDYRTYIFPEIPLNTVATNHSQVDCWTGVTLISDPSCAGLGGLTTEPNPIFCAAGGRGGGGANCTVSLAPVLPTGLTPMGPALQGAINYVGGLTTDATGKPLDSSTKRVVVLLTDGAPTVCDGATLNNNPANADLTEEITIATNGYRGTPTVTTYTIGVPGAAANLTNVATAGGGQGFQITSTGSAFITDLVNAFKAIATSSMSCSFAVPAAPAGQQLDPNAVSVQLTAGGTTTDIVRDTTNTNGWNYTSGGADITLFGTACTTVQTNPAASIQILAVCAGDAPACGLAGAGCGGETYCCLGYHCDSASDACLVNGIVVQ